VNDLDVVIARINADLLEEESIQHWKRNPRYYVQLVVNAVYTLVKRDYAPPPNRMRSALVRETLIPGVLETSKTVIKNPPDVFIDVALDELDGALNFFKAVPDKFKQVKSTLLQKQFAEANGRVIEALEDYRRWLVSVRPTTDGQFSLGEENFRKKLRYEEMVEYSLPQLLAIGEDNLRNDQKALQDAALQIHPNVGAGVAVNKVTTELDKLAAEDVLPMAREQLLQLRKFISEHGLTPLPRETKPRVTETPEFAQAITEAAMDPPGPYETGASEADYWITPSDVDDIWELENTSIHEVFCGHFVQLMLMRSLPNLSMVRRLNGANSNTEGWALYCEQLMLDEGYGREDSTSKLWRKFAQLKGALMRDVRWIAGIKLHTEGMGVEEAAKLFETEAHLKPETALKEARRGTLDPTYLYYTLGKLQIMKLRDEWIQKQGAQYSNPNGEFHRQLLEVGGTLPIEIIRREMTGGSGQLLSK